ncbi:MAG TPA: translocation/assembly module TamB domain-containing protein, partial [Minicystis sp.]|nr:translocation/assembly module TamB domain-containing protein [Minicystis sp.]
GELKLRLADVLAGQTPAWTADVLARLTGAPLADVPFFADREVSGHVNGTVRIDGIHDHPTVHADLDMPDLAIGQDLVFSRARVAVDIARAKGGAPSNGGPDRATLRASVDLATDDGGSFTTTARAGVIWQDGVSAAGDPDAGGALEVRAHRFRLAALHPAVATVFSKLDGLLDGDASVSWAKLSDEENGVVRGSLKVQKGVFHVPQLGQEFHDARLTMRTLPHGVISIDELAADGTQGHVGGKGKVHLAGLKLRDASVELAIADGQDVPLTLEGVPLGNLRGKFRIVAKKDDKNKELDVDVHIPSLHLELPPAPGRGVQALDDNPDVHVSHVLHAEEEPRSPSATRLVFTFRVGEALVEGTGLRIAFSSAKGDPPKATIADDVSVSGDIHLTRGKLTVFGKEFTIEETAANLVHMQGDASNPYLNVTARWDAPDGTEVFIDYVGPLQPISADKIKLRSVPAYPPDQIMTALLLGGDFSQTQQQSSAQQFAGGVAAGVGGSLAAQQFNALLSGIAPLRGFSTRINTAQDGSLQGSLVYDISDKFSATATFDQSGSTSGTPAPPGYTASTSSGGLPVGGYGGTAAQRTGPTTTISVDWHFWKNWLLRGSVGLGADQPMSGLDFLWQYRY